MTAGPWTRRAVVATICLAPVAVPVASLVAGLRGAGTPPFAGSGLTVLAVLHAAINARLAAGAWLWRRRHGSLEGFRGASALPLVGNLLAVGGCAWGFGAVGTAAVGLLTVVVDVGGLPWFLAAVWRQDDAWELPLW